jgi:hypothetical protein
MKTLFLAWGSVDGLLLFASPFFHSAFTPHACPQLGHFAINASPSECTFDQVLSRLQRGHISLLVTLPYG